MDDNKNANDVPPPMAGAAVVHVALKQKKSVQAADAARHMQARDESAKLEEAVGLAQAINLPVLYQQIITVSRPTPATLLGRGQVAMLAEIIKERHISLVVINGQVTPVQQRNLEQALGCKVIDRTGLILEIFGARAQTREGTLQVELAALTYQKSRLVRSWTHLERQRGGFGFMGGPGERQLELDKRMIGARIEKIKAELEEVRRTRGMQRSARKKREQPLIALVGYTNAGKSSLFNYLTAAGVLAQDLLFATLDPVMRLLPLAAGKVAVLSDTVGFIADLPTHLVDAFHATLEEVENATVILHVRDIAHADSEAQKQDVLQVLASLHVPPDDPRLVEVLNKIDALDASQRAFVMQQAAHRRQHGEAVLPVSALTGEGTELLREVIAEKAFATAKTWQAVLPYQAGAALAWLYDNATVQQREDTERGISVHFVLDETGLARWEKQFGTKAAALRT